MKIKWVKHKEGNTSSEARLMIRLAIKGSGGPQIFTHLNRQWQTRRKFGNGWPKHFLSCVVKCLLKGCSTYFYPWPLLEWLCMIHSSYCKSYYLSCAFPSVCPPSEKKSCFSSLLLLLLQLSDWLLLENRGFEQQLGGAAVLAARAEMTILGISVLTDTTGSEDWGERSSWSTPKPESCFKGITRTYADLII